jgi:hypothetical protein
MERMTNDDHPIVIAFDYGVTLRFASGAEVRIGTDASIGTEGAAENFDPESAAPVADRLVSTLRKAADVDTSTATLRIRFEDGTQLVVEPSVDFEAWTYAGSDGHLVVCGPGGHVTRFPARDVVE